MITRLLPPLLLLLAATLSACGGSGPNFSLSAGNATVSAGGSGTVNVLATFAAGASGSVALSLETPAGVSGITGTFNPPSLSSAAPASLLTLAVLSSVPPQTYTLTVRAGGRSTAVSLTVLSGGDGGGAGNGGDLAGTVSISTGAASSADLVPGQVIIKFRGDLSLQSLRTLSAGGVELQQVRRLSLERTALYRAALDAAGTLGAVAELSSRPDVEYAQPNFRLYPRRTPNDPLYGQQWHYPAINLPQAWDLERGQTNPVTVAVVDTGQLLQHPDFDRSRVLPGFDMISDPRNARDGDGRDNNPDDLGDLISPTQSSYHGTHVAGTILANSDNGAGVAGVSWGARLLPVRVLGVQGGDLIDITDGMLWAAGLPVEGAAANPNPAAVINMSLGGSFRCTQAPLYQEVINRINAAGSILVVAAGNEHENAANFSPASCSGVITVGATGPSGGRAPYSNFGARIDLMAPGGNTSVSRNGVPSGGGVLSTLKSDPDNQFNYEFYNGTSMASPHVAGLVALMKSARPGLTRAEALDILRRTARPLNAAQCQGEGRADINPPPTVGVNDCGAGLVDAFAALQALGGGPVASFNVSVTPGSLTVAPGASAQTVVGIERVGGFAGAVSLSLQGAPAGVTGLFTPNPSSGATATLALSVAGGVAPGQYPLTVQGTAAGRTVSAALALTVGTPNTPTVKDTFVAALFWTGTQFDVNRSKGLTLTADTRTAPFSIAALAAGQYAVAGWKDVNANDKVDQGDYFGVYRVNRQLAFVRPPAANVNVNLELTASTQADLEADPVLEALKALVAAR